MGEWVAIASAVSSVIGAVGSIAQGEQAKSAAESEAAQYRDEAETARVNAVIEETDVVAARFPTKLVVARAVVKYRLLPSSMSEVVVEYQSASAR